MKTAGELIRELIPTFYPDSHTLNLAVNAHRRATGLKNWHAAATDLLEECKEQDDAEAFLHSLPR